MNSKATVFVLFAFVAVCYCQVEAPKKCCFADGQFEAFYGGSVGYYQGETPGSVRQGFQQATDVSGQRIGTEGYYFYPSGLSLPIKTIQLFKEGKQYVILNDVCTAEPVSSTLGPKKCIPGIKAVMINENVGTSDRVIADLNDDAKFMGYLNQGVDELHTVSWQLNFSTERLSGSSYLSVSSKTCAPLGTSSSGVMDHQGTQLYFLTNGGYFNITKGITDPDRWFSVPSSCTPGNPKMKFTSEKMNVEETLVGAFSGLNHGFF